MSELASNYVFMEDVDCRKYKDMIEDMKKELETYVKLLPNDYIMSKTKICLNPHMYDMKHDEDEFNKYKKWVSNPKTKMDFIVWLRTNIHKVDGTSNNWNCGFMGSRWVDMMMGDKKTRIYFYSRIYNPGAFPADDHPTAKQYDGKDYVLFIDPY